MKLHSDSHLDHNLTSEQKEYVLDAFADQTAFFVATIELADHLGTVPCGLHGPIVGDDPVPDSECTYEHRGDRPYPSRLCARTTRPTRTVTVIAGPHDGESCVVYTMFGGPMAPQEPGELEVKVPRNEAKIEASRAFWRDHALTR